MFAVKPRAYGASPAGATEDAGEEEGFLTGRVQPSDVRSCRPDGVGTMEALSVNPLDIRRTAQPTVWTRVFRRNGTQTKCASLRAVLRFRTRHTVGGAGGRARASSGREGTWVRSTSLPHLRKLRAALCDSSMHKSFRGCNNSICNTHVFERNVRMSGYLRRKESLVLFAPSWS